MADMLFEGDRAADFSLHGDGQTDIALSGYAGRKLVLFFYPRDDTSGCTREAIDFTKLSEQFAAAETDVVGISSDSVASHDKFKAKHGITVPLGADPELHVLTSYGVWVEKSMYGRKYMGTERTTMLIDRDCKIARVWRKVKVTRHAADVLAAAQNLA